MSDQGRCCGGRCNVTPSIELSRREFLTRIAAGTAALSIAGQMTWAEEGDGATRLLPPTADAAGAYPITPGRIYQGKSLEAVGMPVGGIGTGSIWLDGQGKLGVWRIFNNLSEPRIPGSFFAVRGRTASGKTVTRVLQTEGEGELQPMSSLQYEGSHPIARLSFQDAELPVQVHLEAMNPMIPLDTANSSIPGGLFRLTAKNPGKTAVDVSFCATLQNAVGSGGANGIQGVRFAGYGGNKNRVVRRNQQTTIALERSADPVPTGPVKIRQASGREVEGPQMLWIAGMPEFTPELAESMSRIASEGGILLADGVGAEFFRVLARLRATGNRLEGVGTVFEDFEDKAYEGWEIDGPAFGDGPSHGTEPGQQQVTGFAGRGLVNTFQGGDGPQGTASSKTFTIQRRYLGFLIGGGDHKGQTCINLRVDNKVVRTAVGKNRETLEPTSWDLADLQGKQAVIEIVDKNSEGWGHINIDRILFSDISPEPFLTGGTALEAAAEALNLTFQNAEPAKTAAGQSPQLAENAPAALAEIGNDWSVTRYTRLTDFDSQAAGYRVVATTPSGDPLLIEGPLGKGRIILALATGLPWSWGSRLLLAARSTPLEADERIVPGASALGTMALTTPNYANPCNSVLQPGLDKDVRSDNLAWSGSTPSQSVAALRFPTMPIKPRRYPMKQSLLFLSIIVSAGSLFASEPVWVFNNGPDAKLISLGQGQLHYEVGLTKLIPTGTDLTLTVPMGADDAFPADERPFFAVRYKYNTTITQAGLFFTTDTLPVLSDKSYSSFSVVGDNTWRTAIVNMRKFDHQNWKGTITSFRFDPTNPSDTDSIYQVSRLGFFPSEAEAQRFLDAAVDAPDYAEPTHFTAPLERVLVPGGCLSDGFNRADFMLRSTTIDNPSETTVVRFRPRDAMGDDSVVPVCQTNRCGFTHFVAKKPGKYHLVNEVVSLDDISSLAAKTQLAIQFVVARQLLDEAENRKFHPNNPLSDSDWNHAVELLGEYDIHLETEAKPATRAEAAIVLKTAIQTALGIAIESPYPNEYFTRDRIRIGAWVSPRPEAIGKDFIETYRSGGFDWIIAHGALAGSDHREMLLRDCGRYGVELILGDGAYKNPAVATAEYFDHPCFAGTYVTDEPGTDQYDKLAEICNTYYKETGGKLPYINLLPMYANAAQLKYGASAAAIEYYDSDPDLFKNYCDAFCEKFDPPYICTDIYPLNWVQGKRATYKDYCESINIIAASAREHGKDFWCCIQTFAWVPGKRTPTESEFRWQSYCMLSFGCKGLLCWTYAGYKPECPSLITVDGKRTNAWYDAATVFKEIRRVSDAFVQYRNIGTLAHNCTDDTPYLKFSKPIQTFSTIQQIQCDDPLLVGCFAARDGPTTALTIVNMSELEAIKTAHVKLKIAGSMVVAWPRGHREVLIPDADRFYHLTLPSGEGIFVEVE